MPSGLRICVSDGAISSTDQLLIDACVDVASHAFRRPDSVGKAERCPAAARNVLDASSCNCTDISDCDDPINIAGLQRNGPAKPTRERHDCCHGITPKGTSQRAES